ncbi:MAG: J domain-containing protein [Pseudomonadota bacterium]|nr:J domain-containing protein [Pseudomonadota bacterium]
MSNLAEILRAREVLGLGDSVSLKALRERYIFLAKRFHPDATSPAGDGDEPSTLAEITHAYQLMVSYLENVSISLDDDDVRKNDPQAYHSYRFHDWMGGKS